MNRNIFFTAKDTAELIDKPMPEVSPGSVLVKLVRSTISSGTERANLIGTPQSGVGTSARPDDNRVIWPRQAGYSSSGVVVDVGEGVTQFTKGDRVALIWSKHSEYCCMPAENVFKLPDSVSFEEAALANIATFPMAAIRKCRIEMGESAIVMGQGVLGQLAVILLRAAGAIPVIAADPVASKRDRAIVLGADAAFDPTDPEFAAQVRDYTKRKGHGIPGIREDSGPHVGIEVTGNGKALDNLLDVIAPFGRIALLGCTRDSNFTIDYYHKVHGRGVTLVGAHTAARPITESAPGWWTARDDVGTFLNLLAYKRISLNGFVSEIHKPEECPAIYSRLAAGGPFPVVQFDWE